MLPACATGLLVHLLALFLFTTGSAPVGHAEAPQPGYLQAPSFIVGDEPAQIGAYGGGPVASASETRLVHRSPTRPVALRATIPLAAPRSTGELHRKDSTLHRRRMSAGVLLPYRGTAPPLV